MHRRILFGVAAWLLGAVTATAGSLLAVSLLGQGITGNSEQLLNQDAVNRALASEAAEASASQAATTAGKPSATQASPAPPTASAPATRPPGPEATTAAPDSADGTILTSAGGEVMASCLAGGAYLISWSPLQGYEVSTVARGPASVARVTFSSAANLVTMVVSCSAGVPSATSSTQKGGDD